MFSSVIGSGSKSKTSSVSKFSSLSDVNNTMILYWWLPFSGVRGGTVVVKETYDKPENE